MSERRMTNWLLAAILVVLALQAWRSWEGPALADTLRLDACITEHASDTPQQYVHVVTHTPREP